MNRMLSPLAVLLAACTSSPAPVAPPAVAPVSAPAPTKPSRARTEGPRLDPAALKTLLAEAEETSSDAVVILHDGRLVGQWTFGRPEGRIEAMSVTKSIVSMGVGAAITAGKIPSLDTPAHAYFPAWADGPHAAITLRHLLDNTSGLHANRTTENIYASDDFVAFALGAELDTPPGTAFKYNNRAFNLLPAVIEKATGRSIHAFMQEALFTPLGIEKVTWSQDDSGHCHGMSGLQIVPLDLARLGQLMLDGGVHRGQELLDADFVAESLAPSAQMGTYGLGWWLEGDRDVVIDEDVLTTWRADGVEEDFIERVAPMVGKPMSRKAFFAAVEARFEGHGGIDRWHATTWKQGRPDAKAVMVKVRRFAARGYLGQYLVVLPEHRLVAVRMRRADDRGDEPALRFSNFEERVLALVEPEAR